MKRYFIYAGIAFALLAGVLVLSLNQSLAGIAQQFFPGTFGWIFSALLAIEALALLRLWRGFFGGKNHLVFAGDKTPEEQDRFAKEFSRRLRTNPHLDHTVLDPADDTYTEQCLAILKNKADKEIRRTAERIFVATSLSQNGRLDALIVFASLCRLVWRISGIYNQKPHPSEITSLYWSVVSATFIALSFEDLDISTEITVGFGEAFNAMAPAAMTGSVPFVGAAMQTFTASVIGGAANAFLALRTGIITRNAYAYAAKEQQKPSRTSVYKEAGSILLAMSGALTEQFSKALSQKLWGATKSVHTKTLRAGQHLAGGISAGVSAMGTGVASGVSAVGTGVVSGVSAVGTGVVSGVSRMGGGIASGVTAAGAGVASGVSAVGTGVVSGVSRMGSGIVAGAVKAKDGLVFETAAVAGKVADGMGVVKDGVNENVTRVASETVAAAKAATLALRRAGRQVFGRSLGKNAVPRAHAEKTSSRQSRVFAKKDAGNTSEKDQKTHEAKPDQKDTTNRKSTRMDAPKKQAPPKPSFFARLFGMKASGSKKTARKAEKGDQEEPASKSPSAGKKQREPLRTAKLSDSKRSDSKKTDSKK